MILQCDTCGKSVEFHPPRGWNLRTGLVVLKAEDGKHKAYLNPSDSFDASAQLAAINNDLMRRRGDYYVHGRDCSQVCTCWDI